MTDLWQEAIDQAELSLRGDTGARRRAASVTLVLSRSPDLFLRSHPGRDLAYLVALSGSSWGRSAPQHLLSEDREEFERILDKALRSVTHRPELAAAIQRLNPEQLRAMALNASAIITAAAAREYEYYVKIRDEVRSSALSTPSSVSEANRTKPGTNEEGLAASTGEAAESAGAGAVAAVLAPVLAGTAAVICLLVGYILKVLNPKQAIAQMMLTAGWVFAAVAAAAILVGTVGLLLVALRSRRSPDTDPYGGDSEEVSRAREAWHEALLERGVLPFLRDALADPETAAAPHRTAPRATTSRLPHLGYGPISSRPDEGPTPGARPRFTKPDYSSPDFGGPEHWPE
ncbi:hypothetical protein [Streptomyces sp. ATCC 21386]|uniref:hypothetical protein n=1 Tax=Streptomyces sp. ATCC 21386 TaxID=2699428 RepID=UPI002044D36A|nr:hypothetical protein [Streptomyces sp. ATCC 21386]